MDLLQASGKDDLFSHYSLSKIRYEQNCVKLICNLWVKVERFDHQLPKTKEKERTQENCTSKDEVEQNSDHQEVQDWTIDEDYDEEEDVGWITDEDDEEDEDNEELFLMI